MNQLNILSLFVEDFNNSINDEKVRRDWAQVKYADAVFAVALLFSSDDAVSSRSYRSTAACTVLAFTVCVI